MINRCTCHTSPSMNFNLLVIKSLDPFNVSSLAYADRTLKRWPPPMDVTRHWGKEARVQQKFSFAPDWRSIHCTKNWDLKRGFHPLTISWFCPLFDILGYGLKCSNMFELQKAFCHFQLPYISPSFIVEGYSRSSSGADVPRPKYKQSIGDVALRRVFGATWAVFPCSNSLTLVAM